MKTQQTVRIKLEPNERCEVYVRAGAAQTTATYFGPGVISIVRWNVTERKESEKK
jgi:hypothetical protein